MSCMKYTIDTKHCPGVFLGAKLVADIISECDPDEPSIHDARLSQSSVEFCIHSEFVGEANKVINEYGLSGATKAELRANPGNCLS